MTYKMNQKTDPYEDLFFDFNLIRSLPYFSDSHPDHGNCCLAREYENLLARLEKEKITEAWQIAHLDSLMILHLYKHGALPRTCIERLSRSGHISIYFVQIDAKFPKQECVRLLPKGLLSATKSLQDYRVASQTFPLMYDLTFGRSEEAIVYDYVRIESLFAQDAICSNIVRMALRESA